MGVQGVINTYFSHSINDYYNNASAKKGVVHSKVSKKTSTTTTVTPQQKYDTTKPLKYLKETPKPMTLGRKELKQLARVNAKETILIANQFLNNVYDGFHWNINENTRAWYQSNNKGDRSVLSLATLCSNRHLPSDEANRVLYSSIFSINQKDHKIVFQTSQMNLKGSTELKFPKSNLHPSRIIPTVSRPMYNKKTTKSLGDMTQNGSVPKTNSNSSGMEEKIKPLNINSSLQALSSRPSSFKNFASAYSN